MWYYCMYESVDPARLPRPSLMSVACALRCFVLAAPFLLAAVSTTQVRQRAARRLRPGLREAGVLRDRRGEHPGRHRLPAISRQCRVLVLVLILISVYIPFEVYRGVCSRISITAVVVAHISCDVLSIFVLGTKKFMAKYITHTAATV